MAKTTIGGIVAGLILLIALSTFPNQNVTDAKSAVKNAGESYATDITIDSSGQAINSLGKQAIQNSCENPNSNWCTTTKNSISITSVVWIIFIMAIIADGLIGFTKWIIRSAEFVVDLVS